MSILTLLMQVYIVSGGYNIGGSIFASKETLEKDKESAWQMVADLPSARSGHPLQNDVAAALQSCFKIINLTLLPRTVSNCCLYLLQGL